MTAGIRGTDVWGKAAPDRDVVCLLEGRISVTHGAERFTMAEPMSFYIAPRTGKAQPPSRVTAEQVRQWSTETEIVARSGALRRGGKVSVTAASAPDEAAAGALRDKLRTAGFPAELVRARAAGGTQHQVRLAPLTDAAEAGVLARRLQALGYREARATQ